jgi:hypothetical protein
MDVHRSMHAHPATRCTLLALLLLAHALLLLVCTLLLAWPHAERLRLLALLCPPALARPMGTRLRVMKHLQHEGCCNIRLKQMQHLEHMLATYM